MERSRNVEDLHHLRLMALLHELVRERELKGAAEALGLDTRTLTSSMDRGALSGLAQVALERWLLAEGTGMRPAAAMSCRSWRGATRGWRRTGAGRRWSAPVAVGGHGPCWQSAGPAPDAALDWAGVSLRDCGSGGRCCCGGLLHFAG